MIVDCRRDVLDLLLGDPAATEPARAADHPAIARLTWSCGCVAREFEPVARYRIAACSTHRSQFDVAS